MIARLTAMVLGVLCTGCTFIDHDVGRALDPPAISGLATSGAATVDDVLRELGPPHRMSATSSGYVFIYQHFSVEERQLGMSSRAPLLRWFKLAIATADIERSLVVLDFDRAGRLRGAGLDAGDAPLGGGFGVHSVLVVTPLVDSREFTGDVTSISEWGMAMLRSPAIMLNAASSMDSGEHGLELRSTPLRVGQRTLEQRPEFEGR